MSTGAPRTIVLAGRRVAYTVRRSDRARQVRLRVGVGAGVEVVVPARGRLPDIPAILRERADWIVGALDRVAARAAPPPPALADGALVPYRGVEQRLVVRAAAGLAPAVAHDAGAGTLSVSYDPAHYGLATVLEWWFRNRAREVLRDRADHFAALLGVGYARLTVRDTRSRWGSCSSRGGLNFSWRLILAPPDVLDYLVVHELAHRRELNHSPRFWAIVAAHCPEYPSREAWLKEHGARLLAVLGPPQASGA